MTPEPAHAASRPLDVRELARRIDDAMLADQFRLRRRLRGLEGGGSGGGRGGGGGGGGGRRRGRGGGAASEHALARIAEDIEASVLRRARRLERLPQVDYPPELPVSQKKDEIKAAIAEHQVVVISGETGSGKTTQIPKICLELGRGVAGLIGHTQPRRIAARSVAARIAEEIGSPLGQDVGYKIRFGDRTSPDTYVKLMTDGILLAETQGDRYLEQYDTIIIDEAHERSLNIDFLMGYLHRVLQRRPELKLIITSATIDPERFAEHFGTAGEGGRPAPIIEVSGRTYPVEVRYRPLEGVDDAARRSDEAPETYSVIDGVLGAMDEVERDGPGDVLVFMPGEREIRETANALRRRYLRQINGGGGGVEVLPLYARLSNAEQQRIFRPNPGSRRIVIATNVAETSLTVPGIRYVIDPGLARISRYSGRSRVQALPIERVSQASADQRKGRCGRVGPGVCYRLYSEEDFAQREAFTPPEILRTNLASVILQMTALNLGRPEEFPFVERPDPRLIRDGYDTLRELNAVDEQGRLTDLGRSMARLPVDPRIARMILAADAEHCLDEVLVIAAGLSIQDPRERPHDKQDAADAAHEKFRHPESDFLTLLNVWDFYHEQNLRLSRSRLAKACQTNFLSDRRMREWLDVLRQLRELCRDLGLRERGRYRDAAPAEPAPYESVHKALLTGLLTSVGHRKEGFEYTGPRGLKFFIFPGSVLFAPKPAWVMSAEIVRTTRMYARTVAKIQPEWIEDVGKHLCTSTYSEPHWSAKGQRIDAYEKVSLLGLEIVPKRKVHYGPIDPKTSRELFIHHGLVEGELETRNPAIRDNRRLVARIHDLENKARSRDLLADAKAQFDFYDARLPADVYSGHRFDRWSKQLWREDKNALRMTEADLLLRSADEYSAQLYPDRLPLAGTELPIRYRYDPGAPDDGVTLDIPLEMLGQVPQETCDKLVPGLLREKIDALIRSLPKSLRRNFDAGPLSRELAERLAGDRRPLLTALAQELGARIGVPIKAETFREDELPDHLRMHFRVLDQDGRELARGRDLAELRDKLRAEMAEAFHAASRADALAMSGLTDFSFDALPETVEIKRGDYTLTGYPAIVDEGDSAAVRVLETKGEADRETVRGVARLYVPRLRSELKLRLEQTPGYAPLAVAYQTIGSKEELKQSLHVRICERLFLPDAAPVRTHAEFMARLDRGWGGLTRAVDEVLTVSSQAVQRRNEVLARLDAGIPDAWRLSATDMRDQIANLCPPGFLASIPWDALRHYPRYLRAIDRRIDRLRNPGGVQKDVQLLTEVHRWIARYNERFAEHRAKRIDDPELRRFRWLIEEYRVALFAQELGTPEKISAKRIEQAWDRVAK